MRTASSSFKEINGIDDHYEIILHNAGITTFSQLAEKEPEYLASIIKGRSTAQIVEQNWIGQAKALAVHSPSSGNGFDKIRLSFTVDLTVTAQKEIHHTVITNPKNPAGKGKWAGWQETRLLDFIKAEVELHLPEGSRLQEDAPVGDEEKRGMEERATTVSPPQPAPTIQQRQPIPTHITSAHAIENNQTTPTKFIQPNDNWGIKVTWSSGTETQQLPDNAQWVISVYLESMGGHTPEYDLPKRIEPITKTETIIIPDPDNPVVPGLYNLGIAITSRLASGQPLSTAAHLDGGMVMFCQ